MSKDVMKKIPVLTQLRTHTSRYLLVRTGLDGINCKMAARDQPSAHSLRHMDDTGENKEEGLLPSSFFLIRWMLT
jgi:hypothetical protein